MRYGPIFGIARPGAAVRRRWSLAGPVAGFLLARYQPRHPRRRSGCWRSGSGDVLVAAVIGPTTRRTSRSSCRCSWSAAGFVVATTVRTAIIFSSVSRAACPATAAALNEASIEVGTRAGIVVVTAVIAQVAVDVFTRIARRASRRARSTRPWPPFRDVLIALGTPVVHASRRRRPARRARAVPGRVLRRRPGRAAGRRGGRAWPAPPSPGSRWADANPLQTVYEHRDERVPAVG